MTTTAAVRPHVRGKAHRRIRDRLGHFVGDVLFRGSIGRSDFPRGDHDTLSTFGAERRSNPFVADRVLHGG